MYVAYHPVVKEVFEPVQLINFRALGDMYL